MLVLARRLNERIVIPSIQTSVQVVGIQGGIVRLGFDAPADVKVFREEVIRKEKTEVEVAETPATGGDLHGRLADAARNLAELRRQLRGQLPAPEAAALCRIDRDLADLARRIEESSGKT